MNKIFTYTHYESTLYKTEEEAKKQLELAIKRLSKSNQEMINEETIKHRSTLTNKTYYAFKITCAKYL